MSLSENALSSLAQQTISISIFYNGLITPLVILGLNHVLSAGNLVKA